MSELSALSFTNKMQAEQAHRELAYVNRVRESIRGLGGKRIYYLDTNGLVDMAASNPKYQGNDAFIGTETVTNALKSRWCTTGRTRRWEEMFPPGQAFSLPSGVEEDRKRKFACAILGGHSPFGYQANDLNEYLEACGAHARLGLDGVQGFLITNNTNVISIYKNNFEQLSQLCRSLGVSLVGVHRMSLQPEDQPFFMFRGANAVGEAWDQHSL